MADGKGRGPHFVRAHPRLAVSQSCSDPPIAGKLSMKTLSRNAAAIAVTAGIITQGQLLWLFGAICLLGLAVLAFVVCSKDGDRRVARFERVVYAFKSHLSEPRRKSK